MSIETLEEIVSGLVALILITTTAVIAISGHNIPDILSTLDTAIIGFFFGSKTASVIRSVRRNGYDS